MGANLGYLVAVWVLETKFLLYKSSQGFLSTEPCLQLLYFFIDLVGWLVGWLVCPRLILNSWPFCLHLWRAGIADVNRGAQLFMELNAT